MAKYFAFSFLSLGAILILSSGDVTGRDVFPLILLLRKSDNALQRPSDLKVAGATFSPNTYRFTTDTDNPRTQLLFCGATPENQRLIKEAQEKARQGGIETDIVSKYCLFQWEETWANLFSDMINDRLFPKCEVEPEPLISRILSDENSGHRMIHCGPEDKGVLYRHGYQIWLKEELFNQVQDNLGSSLTKSKVYPSNNIIDYEIFRICYDSKEKQVLYTQHRVISPKLLREPNLTQEITKEYPMSEDNFDLEELQFHRHAIKYSYYSTGVGSSGTPRKPYRLNKFVPKTDFSFSLWQKSTSHVVNYDLINENLFFLWDEITIACKYYAAQNGLELDVYTKTFSMHEELTEVPQLWIKVIHLNSQAVAIVANNEMDEKLNGVILETYCDNTDYCETFNFETAWLNPDVQPYIMCCAINEELKKLFNFNPSLVIEGPGEAGLLWIDGLIKKPT